MPEARNGICIIMWIDRVSATYTFYIKKILLAQVNSRMAILEQKTIWKSKFWKMTMAMLWRQQIFSIAPMLLILSITHLFPTIATTKLPLTSSTPSATRLFPQFSQRRTSATRAGVNPADKIWKDLPLMTGFPTAQKAGKLFLILLEVWSHWSNYPNSPNPPNSPSPPNQPQPPPLPAPTYVNYFKSLLNIGWKLLPLAFKYAAISSITYLKSILSLPYWPIWI